MAKHLWIHVDPGLAQRCLDRQLPDRRKAVQRKDGLVGTQARRTLRQPTRIEHETQQQVCIDHAKLAQQIVTNDILNGEVIRMGGAIRMAPK